MILHLLTTVRLFILVFLFIVPQFLKAQITFEKTYGGPGTESARRVQITHESGYIMAGHTTSHDSTDANIFIVKTDEYGDTLWTKSIGGSGVDYAYSIYKTNDGNYIIGGSTKSYGAGQNDFYLLKIDGSGNVLWAKTYGGTGEDIAREALQTSDGGYIIAGYTSSPGASFFDAFLVKTNSTGDTVWTKRYGGSVYDAATSVKQTSDGGYILVGETYSFGAGAGDVYLIKTDANGDTLWTKTYGGPQMDEASYIQLTDDGGYIFIGDTESFTAGDADIYVVKTDAAGNVQWEKSYGGTLKEVGKTVEQTSTGYIIAGVNRSLGVAYTPDVWIIKTDTGGDTIWTKMYGGAGHEHGYDVKVTADGGLIAVGHGNIVSGKKEDVFLIKTDSLGVVVPANVQSYKKTDSHFVVYPNPGKGLFELKWDKNYKNVPTELKIINGAGHLVFSDKNMNGYDYSSAFDLSGFAKGIYLLVITDETWIYTKKIVLN